MDNLTRRLFFAVLGALIVISALSLARAPRDGSSRDGRFFSRSGRP